MESAKSGGNGGGEEHDPAGDREEQLKKTGRLGELFFNRETVHCTLIGLPGSVCVSVRCPRAGPT